MAGRIILASGGRYSEQVETKGFLVNPSGGNWQVILTDTAGNKVFEAGGAADVPFYAEVETVATALNMTGATAISTVIIYT